MQFGNIATSISFVMSSLSCNAMLSQGLFFICKGQKVIHSVSTSVDIRADFTVSS